MSLVDRDKVRLLIGDTDEDDPLIYDQEIAFFLEEFGGVRAAAAAAARAIAAKFSRLADKQVGDLSLKMSQKAKAYLDLAGSLNDGTGRTAALLAIPYAGGISRSDVRARESDTDRVGPHFTRDMHENDGEEVNLYG